MSYLRSVYYLGSPRESDAASPASAPRSSRSARKTPHAALRPRVLSRAIPPIPPCFTAAPPVRPTRTPTAQLVSAPRPFRSAHCSRNPSTLSFPLSITLIAHRGRSTAALPDAISRRVKHRALPRRRRQRPDAREDVGERVLWRRIFVADKEPAPPNIHDISVTLETSQLLISPYLSTTRCFLAPPAT